MLEIAEGVVVATEYRRVTVGAIATGRGIVCVDVPPYPVEARQWYACLRDHFKQPIRYVILTDAHRDRLLGLHWFEEADIVAHDATYRVAASLPSAFVEQAADALSHDSGERLTFSGVRLRLPLVTFNHRMRVYVEDVSVPVQSMPGPTPGNVWVHLPDRRVVFTGDSVVLGQPPYMAQTQSKSWLDSLTQLRRPRFAADVIVPGRGPLTHKEATHQVSEIVRQARRLVQRFHRSGGQRMDIGEIVPEFVAGLELSMGEDGEIHRRLRTGLEGIFDELLLEID